MGIWAEWKASFRTWAEWEVAKTQFVKPIFFEVVNHPRKSALCLVFFFYFFLVGVFNRLGCLLEIILAFFARRETQRLVHDVYHNISELVEKMSSFQNIIHAEELLSNNRMMNVKINVLLILVFTCLTCTCLLGAMYYHFSSRNDAGSPKNETPIPLEAAAKAPAEAVLDDDISVSDAGLPTNQQPSA